MIGSTQIFFGRFRRFGLVINTVSNERRLCICKSGMIASPAILTHPWVRAINITLQYVQDIFCNLYFSYLYYTNWSIKEICKSFFSSYNNVTYCILVAIVCQYLLIHRVTLRYCTFMILKVGNWHSSSLIANCFSWQSDLSIWIKVIPSLGFFQRSHPWPSSS